MALNSEEATVKMVDRELQPQTCGIRIRDLLVDTCETSWTEFAAHGHTTASHDHSYFKAGSGSGKLVIATAETQSLAAWHPTSALATDLSAYPAGIGWNGKEFWIYPTLVAPAGTFKWMLGNTIDATGTLYYVAIPALVANQWTKVHLELSVATVAQSNGTAIPAMSTLNTLGSIGLWLQDAAWEGTVYIDDVRATRDIQMYAADQVTIPPTSGALLYNVNLALDYSRTRLFKTPWAFRAAQFSGFPVDCLVQPFYASDLATLSTVKDGAERVFQAGEVTGDLIMGAREGFPCNYLRVTPLADFPISANKIDPACELAITFIR